MNASHAVQRSHRSLLVEWAPLGVPPLLRSRRKPPGSPGSAVFPDQTWKEIAGRLHLSPREAQIVRGVFDDHTEFAIAADLQVSPHTVHTHCERLRHKLGVADRVQLVLCITHEFLRLQVWPRRPLPTVGTRRAGARCRAARLAN